MKHFIQNINTQVALKLSSSKTTEAFKLPFMFSSIIVKELQTCIKVQGITRCTLIYVCVCVCVRVFQNQRMNLNWICVLSFNPVLKESNIKQNNLLILFADCKMLI